MAENSSIEWTDATWNPITGCSVVSPGCTNCYAMKLAGTRLRSLPSRKGLTVETKAGPVWNGQVRMNEEWLTQPLRWRRPRKIFVCAHGDLFAENVPDAWIDRVFAVMALAPRHTFQVLTKRSARMRAYLSVERRYAVAGQAQKIADAEKGLFPLRHAVMSTVANAGIQVDPVVDPLARRWPLRNVWLGVSTEDQRRADERVPDLLATPAAVRFVSAEPLLGPIDFTRIDDGAAHREVPHEEWGPLDDEESPPSLWWDSLTGERTIMHGGSDGSWSRTDNALDLIITGSESGPRARSCEVAWVRSIRDQCIAADISFFWKQHVENGRKITLPEMDGRTWAELPHSMNAS